jgi:beta-galactosidase
MNAKFFLSFILLLAISTSAQNMSGTILFDNDWRFFRGGAQGAESVSFDDKTWRKLDLPHDWSIEDLPGTSSPFNPTAISQVSGGFTTGGTGWYRKTFNVPAAQKGKQTILQFDGVYMNADVYLNGKSLGTHPYGYTSFWYDITDRLNYGGNNTLAVKVRNEGENSRWYSGSGIYRHVWLKITDPVHVANWSTFITTPEVSTSSARVNIKATVRNDGEQDAATTITTRILDPNGREVAKAETKRSLAKNTSFDVDQNGTINSPSLWSTESPNLYKAVMEISTENGVVDRTETSFGIRTLSFDAKNGFQLNGQPLKIKGGCVHHDNGPLGARAYDRAEERRVELLKAAGFNAIRSAHNPPSPAFLNACDRLGMLVLDETFDMWNYGKNPADYHLYFKDWWQRDVESMVFRDRNHPSVFLWSIGNEIPERATPEGVQTAQMLRDYIKTLDPTRAITSAVNSLQPDKDPYFAVLDVAGYNYAFGGDHNTQSLHEVDHQRVPQRVIVGTESYPLEAFGAWMEVVDHPYVIGDFVWTAFDYIGEASIGWRGYWQYANFYPWNLAYCGDIDICGWKRPQSFYRDALWKENQLSIFVKPPKPSFEPNPARESWSKWHWDDVVADWNWKGTEGKALQVNVYSSCDEVELFLNGKSLGRKPTNRSTKYLALFDVPYQAGTLKAVGYRNGQQINTAELSTATEPSQVKLTADRTSLQADNQDLSYITVELLDAKGRRNPKAENLVQFDISGPATIVGVGNANPVSLESYQQPKRKAWQGRCLVVLKAGKGKGTVTLRAKAAGLPNASVTLHVQ